MMVVFDIPESLVQCVDLYRSRFVRPARPKVPTAKYRARLRRYHALSTRSGILVKILKEAAARELNLKDASR